MNHSRCKSNDNVRTSPSVPDWTSSRVSGFKIFTVRLSNGTPTHPNRLFAQVLSPVETTGAGTYRANGHMLQGVSRRERERKRVSKRVRERKKEREWEWEKEKREIEREWERGREWEIKRERDVVRDRESERKRVRKKERKRERDRATERVGEREWERKKTVLETKMRKIRR